MPLLPVNTSGWGHCALGVTDRVAVGELVMLPVMEPLDVRLLVGLAVAPNDRDAVAVLVAELLDVSELVDERVAVLLAVGVRDCVKNSDGVGVADPVRDAEMEAVSLGVAPMEPVIDGLAVLLGVIELLGVGGEYVYANW